MSAGINGNHVVAQLARARVFLNDGLDYIACGEVTITPFFVFVSGHYGEGGCHSPIVSKAIPVKNIHVIDDHSVEVCEVHDEMDAEAKAQMEADAEENKKD